MKCRCGCGRTLGTLSRATLFRLKQGKPVGYLPGHHVRGCRNVNWNGGRTTNEQGYILILQPTHPNARTTGYILEHRLVMATHLGRALQSNEVVHHVNGDRKDNRLENLTLLTAASHKRSHWTTIGHPPNWKGGKRPIVCITCGKDFIVDSNCHYRVTTKYCSILCRDKHQRGEKAPNAKLSDTQVAEIRSLASSLSHRALAKRFTISKTQVGRIIRDESR